MSDVLDTEQFSDLQARLLRGNFNRFCEAALAPLGQAPARHHRVMNAQIMRLLRGEIPLLMILMPPGSAKSTFCSVHLPPFALAWPDIQTMITASATADLAEGFLDKAERVAIAMAPILDFTLDTARQNFWRTSTGRELRAFGAGAATAGRRADLVVIDDPFGSWQDAQRQGKRDEIWDWFTGDIVNRLRPGGRILLVNTHWHEDDLSGRALAKMAEGGPAWEVVKMQAIYDGRDPDPIGRQAGEALWPEWESLEQLETKRVMNGPMKWAALFQQDPTPAGGILFPVAKIEVLDRMPDGPVKWARHWDIAGTAEIKGKPADWTVGLKIGAVGRRWVIADLRREKLAPAGVEELVVATAREDGLSTTISIPQDPGAAGKFMASNFAYALSGYNVKIERETGNKVDRATPVAAQVDAGNVAMLRAPWNDGLIAELAAFPNGKHDDQVDALSGAFKAVFNPAAPARFVQLRHGVR